MSCHSALKVLREEFRCRNFGFNYPNDYVFYSSQWLLPRWLFLAYRLLVGSFSLGTIIYSFIISNEYEYPWIVYLTDWSYLVLTIHLVLAAFIAVIHFRDTRNGEIEPATVNGGSTWNIQGEGNPQYYVGNSNQMLYPQCKIDRSPSSFYPETSAWYLLLDWLLFQVSATSATLVTITYFVAVYEPPGISDIGILMHIMNSILVLFEIFISALPIRLLHAPYVVLYGVVYVLFSVAYWAMNHRNVLYKNVLDWNEPNTSILASLLLLFLGMPFLHLVFFGFYRLRLWIHSRCTRRI